MKYLVLVTLLVSSASFAADNPTQQTPPWYWEDEAVIDGNPQANIQEKQLAILPEMAGKEPESEWRGDLGW